MMVGRHPQAIPIAAADEKMGNFQEAVLGVLDKDDLTRVKQHEIEEYYPGEQQEHDADEQQEHDES
jgi:hypothetical protein